VHRRTHTKVGRTVEIKAVRINDNPASEFSVNVRITRTQLEEEGGGKATGQKSAADSPNGANGSKG